MGAGNRWGVARDYQRSKKISPQAMLPNQRTKKENRNIYVGSQSISKVAT